MVDLVPFSLYIHIPFCTRKCSYCHFYVLPDQKPLKKLFLSSLKREYNLWKTVVAQHSVVSIYFGGGTPSLIGAETIQEILSWIPNQSPEVEITLEANPENISFELMKDYREAGINRVSIGVQTLNDLLLKKLNRLHNGHCAKNSIWDTARAGFSNISVDLMYDLPGQKLSDWTETLDAMGDLPINHLSLYNLTIEPESLFFKYRKTIQSQMPSEEESLAMYQMAKEKLAGYGFHQYEISAFAKNERKSRHNTGYWIGRPFLGLGPSAFSYLEGRRFRNVANLNKYAQSLNEEKLPIDFEETLLGGDKIRELLAIQLRLLAGVDLELFEKDRGKIDEELRKILDSLVGEGLINRSRSTIQLSETGVLLYDSVAAEIV